MEKTFFTSTLMSLSVFFSIQETVLANANQYGVDLGAAMQGAANIQMLRSISRAEEEDAKYTRAKRQELEQAQEDRPQRYFDEWYAAAAPRMTYYKDFKKVVFNENLAISSDMMRLMAGSAYAADIAY